jgi:hypothetical protein
MEDVLEVYARAHDPMRPLVCLDEFCKQLIADTRKPVAASPGKPARTDYEYERRGMCSAFMAYNPLEQWRGVRVSGRRTAQDWAQTIQWLCDEVYPQAEKIVLVQDNLNTHKPASLYEAFPAPEARRLVERGVRFVELIDTGSSNNWDAHGDMMSHVGLAKNVDQPIGALLADLKARGMLDETLVVWTTEFGRTPFNNTADAPGREHHPWAFTSWLAGGGAKGGIVHGETDEYGLRSIVKPGLVACTSKSRLSLIL